MRNTQLGLIAASVFQIVGCVQDLGAPDLESRATETKDGAVIVGAVNWQESVSLPAGSAERANASAVAYLDIPAEGTRCTGFLIAPDVIMTNQHCIPRATSAQGVRAYFHWEQGASGDAGVACGTFLGNDATLDYALLQCAGSPGDTYGVVELDTPTAQQNAQVYVIHQNCDYYANPSCDPTKKYSPGKITSTSGEIGHDADTLGGSSGSPLFSRTTHKVVGLHHVGLGNNGDGRGTQNKAVPMRTIKPLLSQRYPGLVLGPRSPADQGEPAQQTAADGYEPNDAFAGAVQVQLPFTSNGAALAAADTDFFGFNGGGSRTIELAFTHAAGDLDLYVFDASGNELARSIGTTNQERIQRTFPAGPIVVRVVGYQGAVGAYALTIQ